MTTDRGLMLEESGRFLSDPWSVPRHRPPRRDEVDIAIIGGGFAGLLLGARLREAGIERIRMIEMGGDFGGTWYWNRYPGAQCDIESYLYMPLLEDLGVMPTERYARQPEIFSHCQHIGRHYRLYDDACFNTSVRGVNWDDDLERWRVRTDRGDEMLARFVAIATNGPLSHPMLPAIPGIDDFQGKLFHTSRWDYGYTGGSTEGNLTGLVDKRVGIIGTSSTAVQCIPHLARHAAHLYVFQRTPTIVDVQENRPTDPAWSASLEAGWQKRRMDNYSAVVAGDLDVEDSVSDCRTEAIRTVLRAGTQGGAEGSLVADSMLTDRTHARIDALVHDRDTREALKPYYPYFCRRACMSDSYYETFNQPNVSLIDTAGVGVSRLTSGGVVANGKEYGVDCLIFATGFEVGTPFERRSGYDIVGRGGQSLNGKWSDGVATLHGVTSNGFPDLIFSPGIFVQFVQQPNHSHTLSIWVEHASYLLTEGLRHGLHFEPTVEAETAWRDTIVERSNRYKPGSRGSLEYLQACTPSFVNNQGRPEEVPPQNAGFGGTPIEFAGLLAAWRNDGTMPGMSITHAS